MQLVSVDAAEKRRGPSVKTEQGQLVNIIEDLSINDSVVEKKRSSKAERTRSKEERLKGTKVFLKIILSVFLI